MTEDRNIYRYFIPELPVSNAVALKLAVGAVLFITLPIWGAAAVLLGVLWLIWALGKMAVDQAEKHATRWVETEPDEDPAPPAPPADDRVRDDEPDGRDAARHDVRDRAEEDDRPAPRLRDKPGTSRRDTPRSGRDDES